MSLGVRVEDTTEVTSPCWLAQFLTNQGLVIPEATYTNEVPDHSVTCSRTMDLMDSDETVTCVGNLLDQFIDEKDNCRKTAETSNSQITNFRNQHYSFEETCNTYAAGSSDQMKQNSLHSHEVTYNSNSPRSCSVTYTSEKMDRNKSATSQHPKT